MPIYQQYYVITDIDAILKIVDFGEKLNRNLDSWFESEQE